MGIKTVPQPPYSPDLAPCDFWLFPKHRGCDEGHSHAHTRGRPWGLVEVVGTVEQVHCSRRRLLRRGQEFHVCTINKSAHTKKVWKLFNHPFISCHRVKDTQDFLEGSRIKTMTRWVNSRDKSPIENMWCIIFKWFIYQRRSIYCYSGKLDSI